MKHHRVKVKYGEVHFAGPQFFLQLPHFPSQEQHKAPSFSPLWHTWKGSYKIASSGCDNSVERCRQPCGSVNTNDAASVYNSSWVRRNVAMRNFVDASFLPTKKLKT